MPASSALGLLVPLRHMPGLRPCSPSGIPYIRQIGCENAWVNAGHGSLGLTLSVGSAMELAKKMDAYGYA